MNRNVFIFDLFDTIIIETERNWENARELMISVSDPKKADLVAAILYEYKQTKMNDRSITYREARMMDQLKIIDSQVGFKKSIELPDLEFEIFKTSRKFVLQPGLVETLEYLKSRDYLMYIMSNTIYSTATIKRYLSELGILHYFEEVFTSCEAGFRKPSDMFFDYVYKKININNQVNLKDVLFAGNDFEKDILGAISFGFTAFWLSEKKDGDLEETISKCVRVNTLLDLRDYLKNNFIYFCGFQDNYSLSDGPGNRVVAFFQGCEIRCEGCHNHKAWEMLEGKRISVNDLTIEIMKRLSKYVRKVTISGGEPLLQVDALRTLLKQMKQAKIEICLYTGYDFEQVPEEIKKNIDWLKTGKFIKELVTTQVGYYGSKNQKFWGKDEDNQWIEKTLK